MAMRITVNVDEKLIERASQLTGEEHKSALVQKALQALVSWESAKKLAELGGTQPQLKAPPGRRSVV